LFVIINGFTDFCKAETQLKISKYKKCPCVPPLKGFLGEPWGGTARGHYPYFQQIKNRILTAVTVNTRFLVLPYFKEKTIKD
jgi:hypothetical protein